MTRRRSKTKVITLLIPALVLLGLWQAGSGGWIYMKAQLAQVLLQGAWAGTLAGQQDVKPWPWADTWPIARLVVPSLGIDQIVLEGAYGRTLAFGPGHVESTGPLEGSDNFILTGHRDTHFQFLEQLRAGGTMGEGLEMLPEGNSVTSSHRNVASIYGARSSDRRFTHRFDPHRRRWEAPDTHHLLPFSHTHTSHAVPLRRDR